MFYGCIFSIEVPSFQMTLACVSRDILTPVSIHLIFKASGTLMNKSRDNGLPILFLVLVEMLLFFIFMFYVCVGVLLA